MVIIEASWLKFLFLASCSSILKVILRAMNVILNLVCACNFNLKGIYNMHFITFHIPVYLESLFWV